MIFSGYSSDRDAQDLLAQGALGVVQKPVSLAELSEHLARAMVTGAA